MSAAKPFARSQGSGPAVVCLHASGASSKQWTPLAERLSDRYRVIAVDLRGHGGSPAWAEGEKRSLEAEAAALDALVRAEAGGVHLVGHSYGAAVAVKLALRLGERVRSLALYEPVMFRLGIARQPDDPGASEAVQVAAGIRAALATGANEEAAAQFYRYWSGDEAWHRLDAAQRAVLGARMPAVMGCFDALFADGTTPSDLETLRAPTLLMAGGCSPASGRRATEALAAWIPRASWLYFAELGHMGPVTRPDVVNRAIETFLGLHAVPAWPKAPYRPRLDLAGVPA